MAEIAGQLTAAVVVPTYRRPDCLARCLGALNRQSRPPNRIVVVARSNDVPTIQELYRLRKSGIVFDLELVAEPGQAAAIEAGVAATTEAIVAHVDDDTEVSRGWLEGLLAHYGPDIGGVGGRDLIDGSRAPGTRPTVGRVLWYGRHIGNHHLGSGGSRDVDVLKNANISLRRELWVIDRRLRGAGAQTHLELDVCLRARAHNWRLIYDPDVTVGHYPAPRFDGDGRGTRSAAVVGDVAFNSLFASTKHLPSLRAAASIVFAFAVGSRAEPGLMLSLEAFAATPREWKRHLSILSATTRGRADGVVEGLRYRRRRR